MSEYYKPIDISKYEYSVPDEIKEFGDRELTEKELKQLQELSLIPSGASDIIKAGLGVGKAALNVGGEGDKDKKDKGAEKEKELDYDQYAKFLQNGFKNYYDQYFIHPVIFLNEKTRKIGYTVLSMVTGSSITLQPYKLADNDLYKLSTQVLPGKLRTIVQKLFSWFNYERVYYKKMDVTNISNTKDPVRSFKMDQILKEPVYKELNKFNPKRGEKYTCGLIFYDDSKRKLIFGKDIGIEQVTQDKITLSKIHSKEVKKGGATETKLYLKKHEISLSMLIPAYLSDIAEDKMKEKKENKFYYDPIFPMTVSSLEEYEKISGINLQEGLWDKVKGALKSKPTTLVLFYLKPLLIVSESEKELDSFRGDMDVFNFDTHKGYISSLSALMYGEDRYSRGGGSGGPPVKKVSLDKLRKFYAKHGAKIRLYGWTPKLRAILLRYAMRSSFSVYDYVYKNRLKEEEEGNKTSINKEELIISIGKTELPILDLKYIREEASAKEGEVYFVFQVLKKEGDKTLIQDISISDQIRIPSSYFEHIEVLKDDSGNEIPSVFIDESFFNQATSGGDSFDFDDEDDEEGQGEGQGEEQGEEQGEGQGEGSQSLSIENVDVNENGNKSIFNYSLTSGNKITHDFFTNDESISMFTIWYQSGKPYLQINDTNSIFLIPYLSDIAENYKKYLEPFFDANYDILSDGNDIADVKNITPAEVSFEFTDNEQKEYEFTVVKKGKIELIARGERFEDNRDDSPSNSSTIPDTVDEVTDSQDVVAEIESVISNIEDAVNDSQNNQEKARLKRIGDIISFVVNTVNSKGIVDIIELDSSKISDTSKFSDEIIYATSIDNLSDMVIKKYEGNLSQFNTQDNNNYFVIDNMKEIQLQPSSNQQSNIPAQEENNNVPNINNREGEVEYYELLAKSAKIDESNSNKANYRVWKQNKQIYFELNPNIDSQKFLARVDTYLTDNFEYTKNASAKYINNLIPGKLKINENKDWFSIIQKGKIELSDTQQSSTQQNINTPDITKAEDEVKYYEFLVKTNVINSEKANSPTDDKAFFQVWKQGDKYYGRVNPSNPYHKALIEKPDGSLKPFFDYTENNLATKIRNIKPAVFDLSTGQLIERGKLELS